MFHCLEGRYRVIWKGKGLIILQLQENFSVVASYNIRNILN